MCIAGSTMHYGQHYGAMPRGCMSILGRRCRSIMDSTLVDVIRECMRTMGSSQGIIVHVVLMHEVSKVLSAT